MKDTKCQRLLMVLPSLNGLEGNNCNLIQIISQQAVKQGVNVIWFTSQNMPESIYKNIEVRPIFSSSIYETISGNNKKTIINAKFINKIPPFLLPFASRIRDSLNYFLPNRYKSLLLGIATETGISKFARQLSEELIKIEASANDVILVPSADGLIYQGVLNVFLNCSSSSQLPVFHLCAHYGDKTMPYYHSGLSVDRVIRYYKYLGLLNDKIFLYADNVCLSQYFQKIWEVSITPLELPLSNRSKYFHDETETLQAGKNDVCLNKNKYIDCAKKNFNQILLNSSIQLKKISKVNNEITSEEIVDLNKLDIKRLIKY